MPAVAHEIDSGAVMVCVRLMAAWRNEMWRRAQVPRQIERHRNMAERQNDDERNGDPSRGADDGKRQVLDHHLFADVPP